MLKLPAIFVVLGFTLFAAAAAHAGDPTPAATMTPVAPDEVRIRVVSDFNRTGAFEPGESGIPDATVSRVCGDVIDMLPATDSDGFTTSGFPSLGCALVLRREHGWLPITPLSLQPALGTSSVEFFVHDLGDSVMEIAGDVMIDGVPPREASFNRVAPPFNGTNVGCVESIVNVFAASTRATVIVVGADQRVDCPAPGNRFDVLLEGAVVGNFAFDAGSAISSSFIVGPQSMQVTIPFGSVKRAPVDQVEVLDASGNVTGRDCGVVRESPTAPAPPQVVVFILADAVRPGCGSPGRRVQFYRDGMSLDPVLDWVAGAAGRIEVTARQQPPVVPPNTGVGPRVATTSLESALLAMIAGVASIASGGILRFTVRKRV
jgi:hypothetical protein